MRGMPEVDENGSARETVCRPNIIASPPILGLGGAEPSGLPELVSLIVSSLVCTGTAAAVGAPRGLQRRVS